MKISVLIGALLCGAVVASAAQAQPYPAKTIQILLPLQAGSAGDVAMRVVAQKIDRKDRAPAQTIAGRSGCDSEYI